MTLKRVADEEEAVVVVPLVVEPVVVEDAPLVIAVEDRDVPVVIVVESGGASRPYQEPSGSLSFDISQD